MSAPQRPDAPFPYAWLVIIPAVGALVTFLFIVPGGPLAKADLVAYAVCHRIPSHSLTIAGRPLPLCARCTGTFVGALVGLFGQGVILKRGRRAAFPPPPMIGAIVGFMALWAFDGVNSYLTMLGVPHLYTTRNVHRLVTGTLNGIAMSALIYPLFNFTLWHDPVAEPAIRGWRDLGSLLLLEAGLVGLGLAGWDWLLYPLGILSGLGVLTLLTSVNTMLVLLVVQRDNTVTTWRQALPALMAGLSITLLMIGAIDAARFALTGTFQGLPPF